MTQDEVPCVLLLLAELHRCTLVRMSENQANLPYHFCFSENWVIGSCLLSSELLPKGDIFPFYRIPAGTSEKSSHALTGTDCQGTALASTSPAQQVSQLPAVFVPTKDLRYQELHNMMLCQVRDCWQDMTRALHRISSKKYMCHSKCQVPASPPLCIVARLFNPPC